MKILSGPLGRASRHRFSSQGRMYPLKGTRPTDWSHSGRVMIGERVIRPVLVVGGVGTDRKIRSRNLASHSLTPDFERADQIPGTDGNGRNRGLRVRGAFRTCHWGACSGDQKSERGIVTPEASLPPVGCPQHRHTRPMISWERRVQSRGRCVAVVDGGSDQTRGMDRTRRGYFYTITNDRGDLSGSS